MKLDEAIIHVLKQHVGEENRIDRQSLRLRVGYLSSQGRAPYPSDRKVRATIELLRRHDNRGALICSSSGTGGYWMAKDLDELLESYREERRRAINIMVTIRNKLKRGRHIFSGQRKLL